jgi:hypothetical protein
MWGQAREIMEIESCLAIAGTVHRRRLELESEVAESGTAFPKGPDYCNLAEEIAVCESIKASVRVLLAGHLLELDFNSNNRAVARAPSALKNTQFDRGSHQEH